MSTRSRLSQSNDGSSSYATYEAKKAQEWNATQADQIHWERDAAFRNSNYRHLHHQEGLIGTFQVRLLEAADLKRSYWSALAMGPVKLLGLSNSHGAVSSFVSFSFDPVAAAAEKAEKSKDIDDRSDSKPAAAPPPPRPCFVSDVVPHDDNPVWTNTFFDLPLRKGVLQDGQPIKLQLRVDEGSTAVENLMPGVPSGGDARLLGMAELDLTSLCMGQVLSSGQVQAGVLDTWVPIFLPGDAQQPQLEEQERLAVAAGLDMKAGAENNDVLKPPASEDDPSKSPKGRVRLLVSYQPHGMEPDCHDIVALESFARRDLNTSSCRPIIPPRLPLHVLEKCGPWLLVEYQLTGRNRHGANEKACLKIHRNTVFVIERKNVIDNTLNLALLPADAFFSTPLGRSTQELVYPVFVAGKQLLMPALLSSKLAWVAIRTTAMASFSGVHAATSAFVSEGSTSLTQENGNNPHRVARMDSEGSQFVSL